LFRGLSGTPVDLDAIDTVGFHDFGLYCWPRAIHFSAQALEQRTLFGIPRRLEFQKIEYASYSHSDARTVVSGKGVEIVHTGEHADKSRFHDLITERTGESVFGV
jgi:hypothetical protein